MSTLMLEGNVDDRDLLISGLREQLRTSQEALAEERKKNAGVDVGMKELRKALTPLYGALKHMFGEMDAMGVGFEPAAPDAATSMSPRVKAAWDNWKHKLGPLAGKHIDALMIHGAMTNVQLRIAVGCGTTSTTNAIYALNKAGLINKSGGKVSLKEL